MKKPIKKLGRLRYRVTLQRPERIRDSETGDWSNHWITIDTVWASFDALSAREFIQASAEQTELVGQMEVLQRPDLNTQCRVLWDGSIYGISGILPQQQHGRLRLMVTQSEQNN